jgi:hypothetical protein
MADLVNAIISAHTKGVPLHLYVDRSQEVTRKMRLAIERIVAAGVETTIGTSPAGQRFIAHEKGLTTTDGDCWEGSVNFSDSGWEQVNTAFQFNSPEWRDMTITAFNRAVKFAWTRERRFQLMKEPPASLSDRPA